MGAPANDLCANAQTLVCGVPITGSTAGASNTDSPTTCNALASDEGVWYTFVGTGGDVKLSTCGTVTANSAMQPWFAVYSGECNSLVCVAAALTDPDCGTANGLAHEFTTVAGVDYYVFVTAASGAPAFSDFDLTLTCIAPDNDLCVDAETLVCGVPTSGTTVGATDIGSPADCNAVATDLGVWYTFTGNGGDVKLSTCGATSESSGTTPWFAVYSGDCNSLVCVGSPAGADPDCGTINSLSYEFTTDAGVVYSVFVASISGFPNTIDFDLTLTCSSVVPSNDLCANAETLVCGVPTTGTTVGATDTGSPATCDAIATDLGVWYAFVGTGDDVKLSTCGATTAGSASQPWLAVYSGADCGALTCVGTSNIANPDPACGTAQSLFYEFTTDVGVMYYVFVTASNGFPATVDFDLTLTCIPSNDLCSNAETLVCGVPTTGTTVGATDTGSPADCNAVATDLGVWYTFTGTGGDVKLSTCGATTAISGSTPWFAVYTGDCGTPVCLGSPIGGDPDCGTLSSLSYEFTSDAGVIYSVFVASVSGFPNTIDFDLTLTCDPVTGITENGKEEINIYPNPSNGQFVIEVEGAEGDAQIVVLDATGRQVYNQGATLKYSFRKELSLNVASGTYLLQLVTEKGMVTRKIQVN